MKMMKLVTFYLFFFAFCCCCSTNQKNNDWREVVSMKGNFKVLCPVTQDAYDKISVVFDEQQKTGSVTCSYVGKTSFHIQFNEWNVAESEKENSERFFNSLIARGDPGEKEIITVLDGVKATQNTDLYHPSVNRHFLVDKTAFNIYIDFAQDTKQNQKQSKLNDEQIAIVNKFFDSFQMLKNP